ncbi:hypothetical protein EV143_12011 [Flavobacterium chryseum]|uniref:hypothetical protein n=1 Tax=Flavobacterium sp. P3160 TaxID=2512113 RepID=UPI0010EBACEE|nr:hypothetical protein [Flavobacterium sp. P3160]TDO68749.1 hypothetical protein EV143_12011 [Flavobacterium sp. P3160]
MITIENNFSIEDIVYLKHDIEQLPRMIIEIRIKKYDILYEVQSGINISVHHDLS